MVQRIKHPFDRVGTEEITYTPTDWTEPVGGLTASLYEGYAVQSIAIEGATTLISYLRERQGSIGAMAIDMR